MVFHGMAGSASAAQRREKNAFPAFGDGSEQSWSSKGVACAELNRDSASLSSLELQVAVMPPSS